MWRKLAVTAGLVFILWASADLWAPRRHDIREFDARAVAGIETDMWRSYYDQRRLALFGEMAGLMRTEFRFPWLRSHVAAFHAAKAAFIFKKGAGRPDYERALPDLRAFYASIRNVSTNPFVRSPML